MSTWVGSLSLLLLGCARKAPDPATAISAQLAAQLAAHLGITASVECAPGDRATDTDPLRCQATTGDGTVLQLAIQQAGPRATMSVRSGDAFYLPLDRLEVSARREFGDVTLNCGEKYVVIAPSQPDYCEMHRGGVLSEYLRVELTDAATEEWMTAAVEAPATLIRKLFADMRFDARVECAPLPLHHGASATCDATSTAGEHWPVRVTLNLGIDLESIDQTAVLPGTLIRDDGGPPIDLTCPRRVVKLGEIVRCQFVRDGRTGFVDASMTATGPSIVPVFPN
jgi:hypothetical protein